MTTTAHRRLLRLCAAQDGKCHWCGVALEILPPDGKRPTWPDEAATIDHVVSRVEPEAREHPNSRHAVVAACRLCNMTRGAETLLAHLRTRQFNRWLHAEGST